MQLDSDSVGGYLYSTGHCARGSVYPEQVTALNTQRPIDLLFIFGLWEETGIPREEQVEYGNFTQKDNRPENEPRIFKVLYCIMHTMQL